MGGSHLQMMQRIFSILTFVALVGLGQSVYPERYLFQVWMQNMAESTRCPEDPGISRSICIIILQNGGIQNFDTGKRLTYTRKFISGIDVIAR